MSDTQTHTIDTSSQNPNPSLEESYAALKEEGVINDDGTATDTGTDGVSQGNENEADGQTDDRPSWLPEKFKTPEDMAKAYSELEKKQSQGKPKDDEAATDDAATATDDDAKKAVEDAGLDFDAYSAEFAENGELSDKTYKALEKAGIPKSMVDAYISGVEAKQAQFNSQVMGVAGGDDAYASLIEWGGANLSDSEIDAFDRAVNSGDLETAKIAVKGLKAQMQIAQGVEPERKVSGKNSGGSDVYQSQAQVEADMNDPRYQSDEAFRQQVYAKMARSNI